MIERVPKSSGGGRRQRRKRPVRARREAGRRRVMDEERERNRSTHSDGHGCQSDPRRRRPSGVTRLRKAPVEPQAAGYR